MRLTQKFRRTIPGHPRLCCWGAPRRRLFPDTSGRSLTQTPRPVPSMRAHIVHIRIARSWVVSQTNQPSITSRAIGWSRRPTYVAPIRTQLVGREQYVGHGNTCHSTTVPTIYHAPQTRPGTGSPQSSVTQFFSRWPCSQEATSRYSQAAVTSRSNSNAGTGYLFTLARTLISCRLYKPRDEGCRSSAFQRIASTSYVALAWHVGRRPGASTAWLRTILRLLCSCGVSRRRTIPGQT